MNAETILCTKVNWLDFKVERSKVTVTASPHVVKKHFGSHFSPVSRMHGDILMKHYHSYSLPSSRSWVRRSRSRIFSKNELFQQRHTTRRFALDDHLVCFYALLNSTCRVVTKVGVTECGNWWRRFFTSKRDDLFLVIVLKSESNNLL